MNHLGWYSPEAYYYDKHTGILKRTVYVEYKRYFDGDDWVWSEKPKLKIVRSKKEKEQILKENPYILKMSEIYG